MKMPTLCLPESCLETHLSLVGMTGGGKTYAAKGVVEWLLEQRRRVCIIDPTGAWYGIRTAADGGAGFPVRLFGGDHADIPITEHAGDALGEFVGSGDEPCIIDLSSMPTRAEQHRFMARFAESVYHHNRDPLHLVMDEADEFAPQQPSAGAERMLGMVDRIARRGRIRGFRLLSITQRPARLNKDVLTQSAGLLCLQITGPQDQNAVKAWALGSAEKAQVEQFVRSLAGLRRGHGWLYLPGGGIDGEAMRKVAIPEIVTLDTSATPRHGERRPEPFVPLTPAQVSALRARFAASIEEAEDSDPKVLRERVKALEKQLAERPSQPAAASGADAGLIAMVQKELREMGDRIGSMLSAAPQSPGASAKPPRTTPAPEHQSPESAAVRYRGAVYEPPRELPAGPLQSVMGRLIEGLQKWRAIGVERPNRVQLGLAASLSEKSSDVRTALAGLRRLGIIDFPDGGRVHFPVTAPAWAKKSRFRFVNTSEKIAAIADMLEGQPARLYLYMSRRGWARRCSREELARACNYSHLSSDFRASVAMLKVIGVIGYPITNDVALTPLGAGETDQAEAA